MKAMLRDGRARLLATICSLTLLAACGGGGGGDSGSGGGGGGGGGGSGPTTFNLSGTIAIAETAAVDSDTNDINQSGYVANDTAGTAQVLTAPVLLVGSVNEPNTGPRGNNNDGTSTLGDVDDVFRVDLVAGQVVELEFASDPAESDVDLYIYNAGAALVGFSNGTDSRYECVTVTQGGSYFVLVNAFRNASIYNLRIGAPGTSANCPQSTTAEGFAPGELVLEPRRAGAAGGAAKPEAAAANLKRAHELLRAAGSKVEGGPSGAELQAGVGPQVIKLPADAVARSAAMATLADLAAGRTGKTGAPRALSAQDMARRAKAAADPWPEALATLRLAKQLRTSQAFEYVEVNRWLRSTAITGAFPPNDLRYSYQRWHYEQINLPAAMDRITALNLPGTQARPLVSVIDDGVVLDHPDLAPQLFSNGRSFVSLNATGDGDVNTGDNPFTAAQQPVFHGTHVAGTVGAATYDAIGGAGTAPMALILPVRVFGPGGRASTADIIQGMRYSAALSNRSGVVPARRADVINMSLGGSGACDAAFATAIADVRAAGTLVVVAAGNDGRNASGIAAPVGSPANCAGAIAVSATDARRNIANYSNTGPTIRVAAPGGDTSVSTTGNGAPDGVYSDVATFDAAGRRQPAIGAMQGTSMASPHVAGVMALMRYVNPGLSVTQVDALFAAGSLTDELGAAGRDNVFGFGLVNARKAVDAALAALATPPAPPPAQIVALPSSIDFGALQTSAVVELSVSGTGSETFTGTPQVVLPAGMNPGSVTVAATTVGAGGLGRYTVTVDRSGIPSAGTYYPSLRFTLSSARVLTVQLAINKQAAGPGAGSARGNFGPVYVLLVDPATGNVEHTVLATLANGRYTWSKTGYAKTRVQVVAGGDTDNDDLICARGETCGAFPVLAPGKDFAVIDLTGDRSDLNFQVAPLSGMSPAGTDGAAARGWRKTPAD
ncbi:MAG: S8 family serine peptidase [Burkholderiales bacterium]|nr:S8 family serine peptidase [Burkholderiales bacterium]